ncbi:ABC transporter substrate-binding protein [Acidiferrimicrobium sp. IK]|uniref:ABC transporter substrate-binding protein n=1 Tax=Acidiferrimicrobium sp. IK TaxID=2871700 RepID=UPI0021CB0D14|nr:ABC transporter substrate-binding protein [Acidiferrimicrobium sp. IK]MCU4184101.1 ABC transporter substrate-binding protein [Acidiferrimicrobium sp. IK]
MAKGTAVAAALTLAASACGSSKSSSTGSGGSSSTVAASGSTGSGGATSKTITVGVLTDSTGVASSGFTTTEQGIKAGIGVAASKGFNIKYVMADTQSTPAGALAAAQKLVEQDHVFAILEVSSDFYGAAQYLASQHVPVIGGGFDGPEWATGALNNLFDTSSSGDYSKVATTFGTALKNAGVTNVGVLAYGVSSTSTGAASGAALSAQNAGIKVGYQNYNFPFGSTDVQPVAIAMKQAGVDAVYSVTVPSTGFALAAALKALGVNLKMMLLPTGYGGDLLQSPAGVAAAQGVDFYTVAQPVEMNTAATKAFQSALTSYSGVSGIPTFAEYGGYIAVAALVDGLQKAGTNPTSSSFESALRADSTFDAFGLYGTHMVDFSKFGSVAGGLGPDNCLYLTKLSGTTFNLLAGDTPVCGTILPGLKAKTGTS